MSPAQGREKKKIRVREHLKKAPLAKIKTKFIKSKKFSRTLIQAKRILNSIWKKILTPKFAVFINNVWIQENLPDLIKIADQMIKENQEEKNRNK